MSLEGTQPLADQTKPAPPQQVTSPKSASTLLRFLAILVAISFLTSLYVWQASTISELDHETALIESENALMEQGVVELMLDLAEWEGPAYIDQATTVLGMQSSQQQIYVGLSASQLAVEEPLPELKALWQEMLELLPDAVRSTVANLQARQ